MKGGPCKGCEVRDYPTCQTSGSCAAWIDFQEWKRVIVENKKKEAVNKDNFFKVMKNRIESNDRKGKRGVR